MNAPTTHEVKIGSKHWNLFCVPNYTREIISYSVLGLAQQKARRNGILINVKNLHVILPANDMQNKL